MRPELARRMASGFPLAAGLVAALLFGPIWLVYAVMGIFLVLAGREWGTITGLGSLYGLAGVAIGLALLLPLVYIVPWMRTVMLMLSALLWAGIAVNIVRIERRGQLPAKPSYIASFGTGVLIIVLAGLGADTLLQTLPTDPDWLPISELLPLAGLFGDGEQFFGRLILVMVLGLASIADIGAYFAGKAWGRRRIAPVISPGKTAEGLAGGMAAAVVLMLVLLSVLSGLSALSAHWLFLLLLAVAVVVVGLLGDLWESLRKRHSQVKDSGSLFAGHGGVLDRLDSHLAVLPICAACLHLLAEVHTPLLSSQ